MHYLLLHCFWSLLNGRHIELCTFSQHLSNRHRNSSSYRTPCLHSIERLLWLVHSTAFCDWSTPLAALRKNRTRVYFLAERCGTPQGACGTLRYGLFYVTSFVNGKILALRCVTLHYRLLEIGLYQSDLLTSTHARQTQDCPTSYFWHLNHQ